MSDPMVHEYARRDGRLLRLDLYRPAKSAGGDPPVVVWIHGGGWRSGSRRPCAATWLTGHGLAVAAIDYRLSGEATFPAQIEDCCAAAHWLVRQAGELGIAAERMSVMGESAGGHLASLLGLAGPSGRFGEPLAVDRVVDLYGPTDFNALLGSSARIRHGHPKAPEVQLIGGRIEENPEAVAAANPISYITAEAPPFLILQGDRDEFVPPTQSYLLHQALLRAGVPSRLHLLEGVGHGGPAFRTPAVRDLIRDFLRLTAASAQRKNGAG